MQLTDLAGTSLGVHVTAYDERDAILHALAVGAGAGDLTLVYERDLRVLPTLLLGMGLWAVERAGALGVYDPTRSLHVSQSLTVHRPLPPEGEVEMTARVGEVWDRGRAAVVEIDVTSDLATARYGIYLPGLGGFGGPEQPRSAPLDHDRDPDVHAEYQTLAEQAVLYRLTGDLHPVHVDPEVAAAGGFDRPILHGLCTLGIAVREVATQLGEHPADLRSLEARFTAPVLPGDRITVEAWRDDPVTFRARVGDDQVVSGTQISFASDGGGPR